MPLLCHNVHPHSSRVSPLLRPASIYHTLNVARRLLIRRPDLQDLFTQSWNVAVAKNGPVARIASAVDFLDAEWTESFVIKTSAGVELNLLSTDKGEFQHNLREAIRQMIIHKDAPIHTRKDLVGGPLFLYESNTKLLRASEKVSVSDPSFKLNLFERATLRNIMTGTTRTAVRLHAANQLDSTTCLWCQLNHEEDHGHFFWTCPAWENKRLAFFQNGVIKYFRCHLAQGTVDCSQQMFSTATFRVPQKKPRCSLLICKEQ